MPTPTQTDVSAPKTEGAVRPSRSGGLPLPKSTLLRHLLLVVAAFLGMVLLIESVDSFRVSQLAAMAYFVPAVAGLTLLTGLNGQISLGHGALMAVGAYTTAVFSQRAADTPFLVVLLVAVVLTTALGALVGAAAARLHGPYLAGATLALAVGLPGIAIKYKSFLGGEQGLVVSPPRASDGLESFITGITGNSLSSQKYLAYLGWLLALIVLFLLSNLIVSRYGRIWRAVRDDEVAAELAGISLSRARVLAFVVSAACAGVGGVLFAAVTRLAAPVSFTVVLSISLLVAIVIGGLGSLVGALIGSALLVFFAIEVTDLGIASGLSQVQAANLAPLAYGVVLILVMLLAPRGIVGSIRFRYLTRKAAKQIAAMQAAQAARQ